MKGDKVTALPPHSNPPRCGVYDCKEPAAVGVVFKTLEGLPPAYFCAGHYNYNRNRWDGDWPSLDALRAESPEWKGVKP